VAIGQRKLVQLRLSAFLRGTTPTYGKALSKSLYIFSGKVVSGLFAVLLAKVICDAHWNDAIFRFIAGQQFAAATLFLKSALHFICMRRHLAWRKY